MIPSVWSCLVVTPSLGQRKMLTSSFFASISLRHFSLSWIPTNLQLNSSQNVNKIRWWNNVQKISIDFIVVLPKSLAFPVFRWSSESAYSCSIGCPPRRISRRVSNWWDLARPCCVKLLKDTRKLLWWVLLWGIQGAQWCSYLTYSDSDWFSSDMKIQNNQNNQQSHTWIPWTSDHPNSLEILLNDSFCETVLL